MLLYSNSELDNDREIALREFRSGIPHWDVGGLTGKDLDQIIALTRSENIFTVEAAFDRIKVLIQGNELSEWDVLAVKAAARHSYLTTSELLIQQTVKDLARPLFYWIEQYRNERGLDSDSLKEVVSHILSEHLDPLSVGYDGVACYDIELGAETDLTRVVQDAVGLILDSDAVLEDWIAKEGQSPYIDPQEYRRILVQNLRYIQEVSSLTQVDWNMVWLYVEKAYHAAREISKDPRLDCRDIGYFRDPPLKRAGGSQEQR